MSSLPACRSLALSKAPLPSLYTPDESLSLIYFPNKSGVSVPFTCRARVFRSWKCFTLWKSRLVHVPYKVLSPPTLISYPRLKYFNIHFPEHLSCIYPSLFTLFNLVISSWRTEMMLYIAVCFSQCQVCYINSNIYEVPDSQMQKIQGTQITAMSRIKLVGKYTV